ncbi:MAG TPA: DUF308 domain-containing protein [Phenylobacterium sp.]
MTTIDARPGPARLHSERRRPALAVGIGMMLLAVAAIALPRETTMLVGAVGGWLLWFAGALMLGVAVLTFGGWLRLLGVAAALSAVGLGIYLTLHPTVGALVTAALLAAALVMDGSFQLAAALHLRPLAAWRWLLASAMTSLVVAGLLASGLPDRTFGSIATLLCAAFATTGAALVATGFARRYDQGQGGPARGPACRD